MNRVMLLYPPGKLYQRGEDRAQCNIEDSTASSVHACNDLGYAAAILRKKGYEVFLRDYQTERKAFADVERDLLTFRPDLVFLSTTNATIFDDLSFVHRVHGVITCKTVLKGAIFFDADLEKLAVLDLGEVDCAIGGELEFVIGDIADCLLKGQGTLSAIPGIVFGDEDGLRKTAFTCSAENLDSLPFPARDLMNNKLYVRPDTGAPMATISVARGCPSNCIYCLTPRITGRDVRCRSVESVLAEMRECYETYGIRDFFFKADTFTLNNAWAIALCEGILRSPLSGKIAFTVNGRADTLTPELLQKMKAAGCFMLAIGFESGSDKSLELMKKGTSVQKNLEAAAMIKQAKIPLFGFFMLGFPWETEADIRATFDHILQIDPDFVELHVAMPFYDTALYDLCKEAGTLADGAFGFDYVTPNTTGTAHVPMERLLELKHRFLLRFYTRPRYLFARAAECLRDPRALGHYFVYGMRLLRHNLRLNPTKKGGES